MWRFVEVNMFADYSLWGVVLYYTNLIFSNLPFIFMHFAVFIILWSVGRYVFLDDFFSLYPSRNVKFFDAYVFILVVLMLLVSSFVSISFYKDRIFFVRNDFIFLAGVLLTPVRTFFVLLLGFIFSLSKAGGVQLDIALFQKLLDMLIIGLGGMLVRRALNVDLKNMGWEDFWFIAVNKLLASVCSAGVFVILFSDSWNIIFHVLVFRLFSWPVLSLPLLVGFIYCMRLDYWKYQRNMLA